MFEMIGWRYRAMPRSRPLTSSVQKKKILERVTELIQYLSRRYGVLRLLANFTAISIFAFLLTPFFFAAKGETNSAVEVGQGCWNFFVVSRYLRSRLVEFYGRRSVLITFDVPGLQHADENVLSVHLLDSSVDVDHFAAHIQVVGFVAAVISWRPLMFPFILFLYPFPPQKWIAEQPMLKLRRRSVLRGWMHLWSNPEGTFQTGNHLVELVPTWKHRLVTEDTVDVSVFCFCFVLIIIIIIIIIITMIIAIILIDCSRNVNEMVSRKRNAPNGRVYKRSYVIDCAARPRYWLGRVPSDALTTRSLDGWCFTRLPLIGRNFQKKMRKKIEKNKRQQKHQLRFPSISGGAEYPSDSLIFSLLRWIIIRTNRMDYVKYRCGGVESVGGGWGRQRGVPILKDRVWKYLQSFKINFSWFKNFSNISLLKCICNVYWAKNDCFNLEKGFFLTTQNENEKYFQLQSLWINRLFFYIFPPNRATMRKNWFEGLRKYMVCVCLAGISCYINI